MALVTLEQKNTIQVVRFVVLSLYNTANFLFAENIILEATVMKKNKAQTFIMKMLSSSAMFCAVLVANIGCFFFFHQEKEPKSVQRLRKF